MPRRDLKVENNICIFRKKIVRWMEAANGVTKCTKHFNWFSINYWNFMMKYWKIIINGSVIKQIFLTSNQTFHIFCHYSHYFDFDSKERPSIVIAHNIQFFMLLLLLLFVWLHIQTLYYEKEFQ